MARGARLHVALTFEAGGSVEPAPAILDTLADWRFRATFFIDGRWAEAHPELVRRIARDGHELASHGYDHPDWTSLGDGQIVADLRRTEEIVEQLVGRLPRPWARPPYGAVDDRVISVLAGAGYRAFYRDAVDGGHWPGETTTATVRTRALRAAESEGVVVFHTNSAITAAVLPTVLDDLKTRGFRAVSLSELPRAPSPRTPRHPDFGNLHVAPGFIQAQRPGSWQEVNLLELAAAASRPAGASDLVVRIGDVLADLVTGSGSERVDPQQDPSDRYVQVLAGELVCTFEEEGKESARLLARAGDLFLCPGGVAHQLGPSDGGKRWIALIWQVGSAM